MLGMLLDKDGKKKKQVVLVCYLLMLFVVSFLFFLFFLFFGKLFALKPMQMLYVYRCCMSLAAFPPQELVPRDCIPLEVSTSGTRV